MTVNIDYHVEWSGPTFYSVPYRLVRQRLDLRATRDHDRGVQGRAPGRLPRARVRRRRYVTDPDHMPASHRAHAEWTPSKLIAWGRSISEDTGTFVEQLLASRPHPEHAYRACLGLMKPGPPLRRRAPVGGVRPGAGHRLDQLQLGQVDPGRGPRPSAPPRRRGGSRHRPSHENLRGAGLLRRGGVMLTHPTVAKLDATSGSPPWPTPWPTSSTPPGPTPSCPSRTASDCSSTKRPTPGTRAG